ncbi:MAG: hypothetical protein UW95_C0030G0003 [Parcubacteria group bacterium GW2011_GWC1_45_14]|nr:MAG: hypothetical protein UW95_C0030G0003 [Parcubacteria group bacterium GW2011_GWC1_45_14]
MTNNINTDQYAYSRAKKTKSQKAPNRTPFSLGGMFLAAILIRIVFILPVP